MHGEGQQNAHKTMEVGISMALPASWMVVAIRVAESSIIVLGNCRRPARCSSPDRTDLPDMIVGLPSQSQGPHDLDRRRGSDFTGTPPPGGFGRSKTFTHSPPTTQEAMRVAFSRAFGNGGGLLHAGEYENLEVSWTKKESRLKYSE